MSWMRRETVVPPRTVLLLLLMGGVVTAPFCQAASIYPATTTLLADETVQLQVDGEAVPPFVWSSTDTNVIKVSAEGLATAIAAGQCRVMAVDSLDASSISGIYTVANLAATPASLSVASDTTAFTVDITAALSDWNVYSFELTLGFDPAMLDFVAVTSEGTLSEAWGSPDYNDLQPGQVAVAHAGTSVLDGDGAFLQFSLRLREAYASGTEIPVSLTAIQCNEGTPMVKGGTGLITVGEEVYVDSVAVAPVEIELYLGQEYTFTASVSTNGDPSVAWSVLQGADGGTITQDGVYTAPAALPLPPSATVVATSVQDPVVMGYATVNILSSEPASILTLVALKNPGQPRSLQIFVTASQELIATPQVVIDAASLDIAAVGEDTNSFSGSVILDPSATSVTISASGSTAAGEVSQQIVVSF
ncbi:MAG: cohesin domain-containing protein [bacterium]